MVTLAVHPHVCGEHLRHIRIRRDASGSSPRVWGTFFAQIVDGSVLYGSSPRVWGTCQFTRIRIFRRTVHPHVCGEHACGAPAIHRPGRFIPTCVGNISATATSRWCIPVHPHVCGEHLAVVGQRFCTERFIPTCVGNMNGALRVRCGAGGSSPRVWGTSGRVRAFERPIRFIPTCVGNMMCLPASMPPSRFIPTCVGNILSTGPPSPAFPVHPHVCGEHHRHSNHGGSIIRFIPTCVGNIMSDILAAMVAYGSSPRVWGTCLFIAALRDNDRFIPTCVGNMFAMRCHFTHFTVHPHVCGEHVLDRRNMAL